MRLLRQKLHRTGLLLYLFLLLSACTSTDTQQAAPLEATERLLTSAIRNDDPTHFIQQLYESRTWIHHNKLRVNTAELSVSVEVPVRNAGVKLVGPSTDDALRSLALKIWMIENAEHTVDAVYYIFKADMAGLAILGALCNAVQRGVDVRIMVDSVGSLSLAKYHLAALHTCSDNAGQMRNIDSTLTSISARVQVVVFNALSSPVSRVNRRSHDKMLVTDAAFPDKALVLTGGRNISTAYYGIHSDGTEDPDSYRDLEILLHPIPPYEHPTVGNISETYFSLLFLNKGNKLVLPNNTEGGRTQQELISGKYQLSRESAQTSLNTLKNFPLMAKYFNDMPKFVSTEFQASEVLLAHELANLSDKKVVTKAVENRERNPNSIMNIIHQTDGRNDEASLRVVSPYLFMTQYYDKDGNIVEDSVANIHQWLSENPKGRFEIITNSVMTSDNVLTQSVIDMEVGPRLLLTPEIERAWLSGLKKGELNPEVVNTEEWKALVNNPQIFVYQTGRLDAALLGNGDKHYGKLHAKFIIGDEIGFVGTSNFDYRSILYNNEMGFFFRNEKALQNLTEIFEYLKDTSYRWGSPEWLQMRKAMMESKGMKAWGTRNQRPIYKLLKKTGFIWLI